MWEAWTTAMRPPSRRTATAAQRLIASVGPPISHWGMSRPLAPLLPRQRGFLFCVGSVARGAAPKPIKQGLSARSAAWSAGGVRPSSLILIDQYLVNLEWRLCRGIPLLSGGSPAAATLADRQVQEADENAHLLLSQSV